MPTEDKAGKAYWDDSWTSAGGSSAIDVSGNNLNNHINALFYQHISSTLGSGRSGEGKILIEAGCGNSNWLPFFAEHFGFSVKGIDYSLTGCEASRNLLVQAGVDGEVIEADLFNLPDDMHAMADVVFSNGLVEHFVPTGDIVSPLASMLKPDGLIITFIPNLTMLIGFIQKHLDRAVYDVHVPLSLHSLVDAHKEAGLEIVHSSYVGTINLSMLNYPVCASAWWYHPTVRIAAWVSKIVWIFERMGMPEIRNQMTSPYMVCVARKKEAV